MLFWLDVRNREGGDVQYGAVMWCERCDEKMWRSLSCSVAKSAAWNRDQQGPIMGQHLTFFAIIFGVSFAREGPSHLFVV